MKTSKNTISRSELNGRRGENIHRLLDPAALGNLAEPDYWKVLQAVQDDLKHNSLGDYSPHEHTFARFTLLAQSVLGGVCWPGAERWLSRLTYKNIEQVVLSELTGQTFLIENRKGIAYPILIHDSVAFALLQLIGQVMAQNPIRNQALRPISSDTPLAPTGKADRSERWQMGYRLELIEGYLHLAADAGGLNYHPTLAEFKSTGRWLLTHIYPLDVIYALLGAVDATAPPVTQLLSPGPLRLVEQLYQPLQERVHA